MFYKIKDKLNRYIFSLSCRKIFKTPPIVATTSEPVAVLTQLQHKDVLMFLIAIKTFAKRVPLSKVIILNDGSLTGQDIVVLQEHISIADIYEAGDFHEPNCPSGGTWERLLAIAYFTKQYFIIQLDSDTLALSSLDEVNQHIKTNTGFVIGTWDNQEIESMKVCSERVRSNMGMSLNGHVQMVAEAHFLDLDLCSELRYVRGCSGFAGFSRNGINKEFIIDFSTQIEKLIGRKWHEWGSEQVMSNVVVANLDQAEVLPHPKYSDCNKMKVPDTCFIHFIGACRFTADKYRNLARLTIKSL